LLLVIAHQKQSLYLRLIQEPVVYPDIIDHSVKILLLRFAATSDSKLGKRRLFEITFIFPSNGRATKNSINVNAGGKLDNM
jgi:hypothetical protein